MRREPLSPSRPQQCATPSRDRPSLFPPAEIHTPVSSAGRVHQSAHEDLHAHARLDLLELRYVDEGQLGSRPPIDTVDKNGLDCEEINTMR